MTRPDFLPSRPLGEPAMAFDRQTWNPDELRHILALAGPEDGPKIVRHLTSDLATTGQALLAAVAAGEAEAMRRAAHVLVALCGTAGAMGLHRLADQLRHLLPAEAAGPAELLGQGIAALIDGLRDEFGAGS